MSNGKGFAYVEIIIVVVIITVLGFVFKYGNNLSNKSSSPNLELLQSYTYDLHKDREYQYILEWEAFPEALIDKTEYFNYNISSSVNLVKVNLENGERTVVKEEIMQHYSGIPSGNVSVFSNPGGSSWIGLIQSVEGTGAMARQFIDLSTGDELTYEKIHNSGPATGLSGCFDLPINDLKQSTIFYACDREFRPNPSELAQVEAKLFTYDFVTSNRSELLTLNKGQRFRCEQDLSADNPGGFIYKYLGDNIQISICNSKLEVEAVKTFSF